MAAVADHWELTDEGWEDGVARLTWLISFAECPALLRTAARSRPQLDALPWLDPVEPRWLHLTVGEDPPPRVDAFVLRFERVELWPTGVMLVPEPSPALVALGVERPHVTLAYANEDLDVDAELPRFEPCATLVERVDRVWLRRHGRTYTWDPAVDDPDDRPGPRRA